MALVPPPLWFDGRSGPTAGVPAADVTALHGRLLSIEARLDVLEGRDPTGAACGAAAEAAGGLTEGAVVYVDASGADEKAPTASAEEVSRMDAARRSVEGYARRKLGERTTLRFTRVPTTYYEHDLEWRARVTRAKSTMHIAKTIVMENTRAPPEVKDCSDPRLSKYYCVLVQYATRLNTDKVRKFLASMNAGKVGSKFFNPRLCPEEVSADLTGWIKGAVVPLAMKTDIPCVVSDKIVELDTVILGAGHVDLKVELPVPQLLELLATRGDGDDNPPFVIECATLDE